MSLARLTSGYSVTMERPTGQQDSSGGPVRAPFVAVLAGISGDLQPADSNAVFYYGQRSIRVTHQFYTTTDIGAKAGYRLTMDSRYFIIHGYQNEAGRNKLWVADVEEWL